MKNKIKKISKLLFVVLLIVLLQIMGYTYAKYIASDQATGEAEIAQWSFKIEKDGGTIKIILDASGSEVDLDYSLQFTNEKNKPANLFFTYAGNQYSSLDEIGEILGNIPYDAIEQKRNIVLLWRWGYETGTTDEAKAANDIIDTKDANSITEYTFDVVVTATQSK